LATVRGDAIKVWVVGLGILGMVLGAPARAAEPVEPVRLPIANPEVPETPAGTDNTVVVERGDHLWKISARNLGALLGRPATNTETGPYWRTVIEANRDGLRSGNPDLIFPGEVLTLPGPG
jgi:nucleoid-associated protein YgaU